jgi:hypothetical protein
MEQKISRKISNIWITDSSLAQYDTVSLDERVPDVLKQYLQNIRNFSLKTPTRLKSSATCCENLRSWEIYPARRMK